MPSLSINERSTIGYGWTDSPVLIYPSAYQTAYLERIIVLRKEAETPDPRALGNTEDIMEMLNDETVVNQSDRWRYVIPDELIKVNTEEDSAFSIRNLSCESTFYSPVDKTAAPIPEPSALIEQYGLERSRRYLALGNRINELRKLCELHYKHVHRITYVYEDHAGYALGGTDNPIGGSVQHREYVGAITNIDQLDNTETIKRGSTFIDYTLPPTYADDRAFNPNMFTGVKILNPNRATRYQIPILSRVFPNLNVNWIQSLGATVDDINANWDMEIKTIKPTSVRAAHINELRKAISAYAAHTHEVALQMVDMKVIDARIDPTYDVAATGTAFGINPSYIDVSPPRYLNSIGDCLEEAGGGGFSSNNILGLFNPIMYHVYYNAKTVDGNTIAGLKGVKAYGSFQKRIFTDDVYSSYQTGAAYAESPLMLANIKDERTLFFHASAVHNQTALNHPDYVGVTLSKASDSAGNHDTVLDPILTNATSIPYEIAIINDYNIINPGLTSPVFYARGTGAKIGLSNKATNAIAYKADGVLANQGRIRVSFNPKGISNLSSDADPHLYYQGSRDRAVIFSHGADGCTGVPWSPAAVDHLPRGRYDSSPSAMNIFCMTPFKGDHYKRTVYNSIGCMPFVRGENDNMSISTTKAYKAMTAGHNYTTVHGNKVTGRSWREHFDPWAHRHSSFYSSGASRDTARGILDDASINGDDFYFRKTQTIDPNGFIQTNPESVRSMSNLIEIWMEVSPFREFKGFPSKDTYTIHASILDINGGGCIHLSGDILITSENETGLVEIDMSFDLKPGGASSLAAGLGVYQESDPILFNVIEISSYNNRISVDQAELFNIDDQVVIGTTPNANEGTYVVTGIGNGYINVQTSDGSALIDETFIAPMAATAHRYTQQTTLTVLCSTESGNPTEHESMDGLEQYTATMEPWTKQFYERPGFSVIADDLHGSRSLGRGWDKPNFSHAMVNNMLYWKMDDSGKYDNKGKQIGVFSRAADKTLDANDPDLLFQLGYRSPTSQIVGFYRHTELSAYNSIFNVTSDDFSIEEDTVPPSVGGESVFVLGSSIAGLNHKDVGSFIVGNTETGGDHYYRPIRKFVHDLWGLSSDTVQPESDYTALTGLHLILYSGFADSGSVFTSYIDVGKSSFKVGATVEVIEGNKETIDAIKHSFYIFKIEELSNEEYSYQRLWLYDNILKAPFDFADVLTLPFTDEAYGFRGTSGQYHIYYASVPEDSIKFERECYPADASKLLGASDFVFKSFFVSAIPSEPKERPVHLNSFKNLPSGKSVSLLNAGVNIVLASDGNKENQFNNQIRSPLTVHLSSLEDGASGKFSSVRLAHLRTQTSSAIGGSGAISVFSNGNYSGDGYNIKQLKGTTRDPNTDRRIEEGDPIRAVDVNELYDGVKWLKNHTHNFEFIHKSDQPIFVKGSL